MKYVPIEKMYENITASARFDRYERKIRFKTKRSAITGEMVELMEKRRLTPEEAVVGLQILTRAFIHDKSSPYEEGNYDAEHARHLSRALYSFPRTNSHEDNENNVTAYLKKTELLINEVDITFPAHKKIDKLLTFAACFHEMANCYMGIPPRAMPFNGQYLRISDKAFHHGRSVLILPDDPKDAVALLHDEKPRILFAQYDEENSAETIAKQLYGTDGGYAEHYKSFLNCKDRYPNQKHLFQIE